MSKKGISNKLEGLFEEVGVSLRGDPKKQLFVTVVALVSLVVTLSLVKVAVEYFSRAQVGTPQIGFSPGSISLPDDNSVKLVMDANGNEVGIVRVELYFDNSLINLSGEITPLGPLTTVVRKTSRSEANSNGKIELVLGLSTSDRSNPPTSVFDLASIPLVPITDQSDISTSISICTSPSTNCITDTTGSGDPTRIADMTPQFLSFTTSDLSVSVNPTSVSPTPTTAPSGNLITNLSVNDSNNSGDWSVRTNLQDGDLQYGDRNFTFSSVPDTLTGAEWIRTANDSKSSTNNPLVNFDLTADSTVYVAVDDRTGKLNWMSDWSDTGEDIINSEPQTFSIYARSYSGGQTVSLGPQGDNNSMYTVAVVGTATSSDIIYNMTVYDTNNSSDWSIQQQIASGLNQYGDRSYTLDSMPTFIEGNEWIRTANDSDKFNENPLVTFNVNQSSSVYVAVDDRGGRPSWMDSGWTDTGADMTNSEPQTFSIYTKDFSTDQQVSLGPNSGGSMYTVVAVSTGTTSSPTPTSSELLGDINGDGTVNLLDYSILSSVFGTTTSDPDYDTRADLNDDGAINLLDYSILSSNFGSSL